jgi:ubiquitin-like-conjugating enzyme ATG10
VEEIDEDCLNNQTNFENFLEFEYHILYSQIYQVPVLYFNVYDLKDGKLLKQDEVISECSTFEVENKFCFITQGQHPILSSMFFYLHPCQTSEFMNEKNVKKENYIVSWLSFFGSMIGYYLPV